MILYNQAIYTKEKSLYTKNKVQDYKEEENNCPQITENVYRLTQNMCFRKNDALYILKVEKDAEDDYDMGMTTYEIRKLSN